MARHKLMHERADGWCDWLQPIQNYRMSCCDCGLVHELEFNVLRRLKDHGDGTFTAKPLEWGPYRVEFRARRHIRSTAAKRRKRKAA